MLESPNREEVAARDEHAFDKWPSFIERTPPRGEQRGPATKLHCVGASKNLRPLSARHGEGDVTFAVGLLGSLPDAPHGAAPPATDGERERARLGGDDQVTRPHPGAHELASRHDEEAVCARGRRAGRTEIREVRGAAGPETPRDEADALDADVPAGRDARSRDELHATPGVEGEDPAADLVRGDQPPRKAAERERGDRDSALHLWRAPDDGAGAPAAVDRVQGRLPVDDRRDEQPGAEAADPVERDPGQERAEEHTSELQSRGHLVCRLLLEKKKNTK